MRPVARRLGCLSRYGIAVHGTYEARNLGHAVSHGCVRLSVKNAATLWGWPKQEKMANTKVVLTGEIQNAGSVAHSQPMPLTPNASLYAAPPPQYQRVYGDRPFLQRILTSAFATGKTALAAPGEWFPFGGNHRILYPPSVTRNSGGYP